MSVGILAGLAAVGGTRYIIEKGRRWYRRNRGHLVAAVGNTLAQKLMVKGKGKRPFNAVPRGSVKKRDTRRSRSRGSNATSKALVRYRPKYRIDPPPPYVFRGRSMSRGSSRGSSMSTSWSRRSLSAVRRRAGKFQGLYAGNVYGSKRGVRNQFDKFNVNGVVSITETIGNFQDQDCVYIMNEVINAKSLILMIIKAIVRRLFEKDGMRVEGSNTPIGDWQGTGFSTANFVVRLIKLNKVTGASSVTDYTMATTSTLDLVAQWFVNDFEGYSAGNGINNDNNVNELHKFVLLKGNAATIGTQQDVRAEMLMNETFIDILGISELKFQNRTLATGGGDEADNVAANPLQGRTYLFRGVPKPKANSINVSAATNTSLFERIKYGLGTTNFGGTSSSLDPTFREPPFPKLFWNVSKAGYVRLEPGNIKNMSNKAYKQGNVLKILKSIRYQVGVTGGSYCTYSIFPVQMIALEDVLNANGTEQVNVYFEVQRTLGVKCWTKQKRYCKTQYVLESGVTG